MAEIPELGHHCSLRGCNQLDFVPFHCARCDNFYCRDHRLLDQHGCKSIHESTTTAENGTGTAPKLEEFKFMCSHPGCFVRERTLIQCPRCDRCFCMKHRLCEEHACPGLNQQQQEKPRFQLTIAVPKQKSAAENRTEKKPERQLTPDQQRRLDRAQIMKMKAKNPLNLAPEQQLFLFANLEEQQSGDNGHQKSDRRRHLVVVNRQWSLLRSRWYIVEQLNLGDADNFDVFRMPTTTPAEQSASNTNGEEKEAQPFPLDEPIEKLFQNESDFILLLKAQIVAQN